MADINNPMHTRSTGGRYRDIVEDLSNGIRILGAYDTPVYAMANRTQAKQTTLEWIEDAAHDTEVSMGTELLGSAGATSLTLAGGDRQKVVKGAVLRITNEWMYVSARSSTTATVVRGYGGTTRTTHATTTVATIVDNANVEASTGTGHATVFSKVTNQCQIFKKIVQVSGTRQAVESVAAADMWAYEVAKQGGEFARDVERAMLHGKVQTATANTTARHMRGVYDYISTNVQSTTTVTVATLSAFFKDIWDDGGNPNVLIADSTFIAELHKRQLDYYQRIALDESYGTLGGVIVSMWVSPWGSMLLLPSRQLGGPIGLTGLAIALSWDQLELALLEGREETLKEYGYSGDYRKGEIIGEMGIKFHNEKYAGVFHKY